MNSALPGSQSVSSASASRAAGEPRSAEHAPGAQNEADLQGVSTRDRDSCQPEYPQSRTETRDASLCSLNGRDPRPPGRARARSSTAPPPRRRQRRGGPGQPRRAPTAGRREPEQVARRRSRVRPRRRPRSRRSAPAVDPRDHRVEQEAQRVEAARWRCSSASVERHRLLRRARVRRARSASARSRGRAIQAPWHPAHAAQALEGVAPRARGAGAARRGAAPRTAAAAARPAAASGARRRAARAIRSRQRLPEPAVARRRRLAHAARAAPPARARPAAPARPTRPSPCPVCGRTIRDRTAALAHAWGARVTSAAAESQKRRVFP